MLSLDFYKNFFIAATIFIVAGLLAIVTDEILYLSIPFLWILLPLAFKFVINKTGTLFYLLIFLLPLSTEYNFTPFLGIDFPDEILMMLLTGFATLFFIYKPATFPVPVLKHFLILLLVIHLLWILVTCFLSNNATLSFKFFIAKSWYIIPFVVLPSLLQLNKQKLKQIGYLLLLPMLFVVVQSLLRHSTYNFSFEGIKETLSPFFRNHVNYSAMLVCLLPVLIAIRSGAGKREKALLSIGFIVAMAGVIFSYSRGAWLAIICGVFAYYVFKYNLLNPAIAFVAVCIVTFALYFTYNQKYLQYAPDYNTTIFHEDLRDHLQATVQFKDVSNAERFYRWIAAGNMISENPITGFGPNTFYQNYKSYAERPFETWVSDNPEHSTVHNYFLLTLAEQGIPGLLFFGALFLGMLLHCQKLYNCLKDVFYKRMAITMGVIITMIGSLLFSSDLIETDKIGSLFWLSLGFIIVLQTKLEKERKTG